MPGHSEELNQAISATSASEVTKLMVATVQNGTAKYAAIPGVSRRRQDRHRRERPHQPRRLRGPAVRLVRRVRPGRPAASAKVAVAVMIQHINRPTERDRRRLARRTDRKGGHGGGAEIPWLSRRTPQTPARRRSCRHRTARLRSTTVTRGRVTSDSRRQPRRTDADRRALRARRAARPRRHGRGPQGHRHAARAGRRRQAPAHRPGQRRHVPGPLPPRGAERPPR